MGPRNKSIEDVPAIRGHLQKNTFSVSQKSVDFTLYKPLFRSRSTATHLKDYITSPIITINPRKFKASLHRKTTLCKKLTLTLEQGKPYSEEEENAPTSTSSAFSAYNVINTSDSKRPTQASRFGKTQVFTSPLTMAFKTPMKNLKKNMFSSQKKTAEITKKVSFDDKNTVTKK